MRRICDSRVPCEKLMRATSRPARTMPATTWGSSVAGPIVATILVLRSVSMVAFYSVGHSGRRTRARIGRALFQHRDRRQGLTFDEFKKRAAAGGNVGDAVLDAVLLDRRQRIAAAGEGKCLAAGDRLGDGARAFAKLIDFEYAHRAVPDDGTG